MINIIKILALLLIGFIGGCISPWLIGWFKSVPVAATDAVSIANTYIVFTTIIFVGVTVMLAVAGFVFTQQFAESKATQTKMIIDELKNKVKDDEKLGIALVDSILENSDVQRHLEQKFSLKITSVLEDRLNGSRAQQSRAKKEAQAISDLTAQLSGEERQ